MPIRVFLSLIVILNVLFLTACRRPVEEITLAPSEDIPQDSLYVPPPFESGTSPGFAAPDFEITTLRGERMLLSDFRGKVVLLNFWATWCAPCRAEIPGFIRMQRSYGKKDFAVLGVSLDRGEPDLVRQFVDEMDVNYTVAFGNADIVNRYDGVPSLPTTFVIDRNGMITHRHVGLFPMRSMEEELRNLIDAG